MKTSILLLCLLLAAPVAAQERPIAGTTVQTTDTSANSLLVGCAVGSTTCTGGIKAGALVITTINGVGVIDATGKIPAISSTYFASLSAANLTSIPAANLTGTCCGSATNVPLLNAVNTFTAVGTHAFSVAGGNTFNALNVRNSSAGTAANAYMSVGTDVAQDQTFIQAFSSTFTSSTYQQASGSALVANSAGGLSVVALNGSGAIRFYTGGGNLRWGINSAGDHTFGASSHIADSSGTPTIASGFGTTPAIIGTDYAFSVGGGGGSASTGTVTFGHTWTTSPICTATSFTTPVTTGIAVASSTTQLIINYTAATGSTFYVLCRSY